MPRKYNRKYKKKRRYNPYKLTNPPRFLSASSVPTSPLPNVTRTRLRYVDNTFINPGVGGVMGTQVYSANGLYDPDVSGVGHQPRGFDELMILYKVCVVVGSKIKVTFLNRDNNYAQLCCLSLQSSSTALSSMNDYQEGTNSKFSIVSTDGSGSNQKTLTMKVNPNKWLNIPKLENTLKHDNTANPVAGCFYHLGVAPSQAVDSSPVDCIVEIEYLVDFMEPRRLTQS